MKQKGRRHSPAAFSVLVRGTRLELAWYNHTPLKRARLPIPPSSQKDMVSCQRILFYHRYS